MTLKQRIRTLTGGLAVVLLLSLVTIDAVDPNVTLGIADKLLLASVASVLLGVDLLFTEGLLGSPLNITISRGDQGGQDDE